MNPTERILQHFEEISSILRGTKYEGNIRDWLAGWAKNLGLQSSIDSTGNLAISVPASTGREGEPPMILQGHLDMVWQKTLESPHDFHRDPIKLIRDGDWVQANQTTLGADNGIALAIMMTIAEDSGISHPALELLFTVEEEIGLAGANNLDPRLITGRTLINLDSEEEGVFTVGCAGGGSVMIHLPVVWENPASKEVSCSLRVQGLLGGHSGSDIHRHRANAIKLMARTLDDLLQGLPIRLASFQGGTARNAIPRDSEAIIAIPTDTYQDVKSRIDTVENILRSEFVPIEPDLSLSMQMTEMPGQVMSAADTKKCIQLLISLPNGVSEMSAEIEGFVETSNNIGMVDTREDGIHITSSQRSSISSCLEEIIHRIEVIAHLAGAITQRTGINPPWKPDKHSALLRTCIRAYEKCIRVTPRVELSHGGLECGILSSRCGGLDAISLGPTILNAHSPDERLFIPSLGKIWQLLVEVLLHPAIKDRADG